MVREVLVSNGNVLRVNSVEERNDYRSAIARILLDIQRDTGATLIDIAEAIGVSLGTISNAAKFHRSPVGAASFRRMVVPLAGTDPFHA